MAVLKPGTGQGDLLAGFPVSFWYYHRMMGNVLQRYGFTLEALSRLGYGDFAEARRKDPVITYAPDDLPRVSGSRTWTGTGENRWYHWIELMDDIPNVGPRRMLELVNYLRAAGTELPWFADWDEFSANWTALQGCHREPPATSK